MHLEMFTRVNDTFWGTLGLYKCIQSVPKVKQNGSVANTMVD